MLFYLILIYLIITKHLIHFLSIMVFCLLFQFILYQLSIILNQFIIHILITISLKIYLFQTLNIYHYFIPFHLILFLIIFFNDFLHLIIQIHFL